MARIDDLLASIDGKPSPSVTSNPKPVVAGFKRKAEDDLRGYDLKTSKNENEPARQNGVASRPSPRPVVMPKGGSSRASSSTPRPDAQPLSAARKPAPLSMRPIAATAVTDGNKATAVQSLTPRLSAAASNGDKARTSQQNSTPRPIAASGGSQPQPKKRSYAEIMRQASEAAKSGAQFGVIHHKSVEPAERVSMKERKSKSEGQNGAGQRSGQGGGSNAKLERRTSITKQKEAPPAPEKKYRKAALATTGYTGTARPQTKSRATTSLPASLPDSKKPSRFGGGVLAGPRHRKEDYDDDLDSFIDDDEGEERRYVYEGGSVEEDESDMEAGIDDIDEEETRAERQARLEDLAEQALEKKMKEEKEQRRRRALAGRAR